MIFVSRDVNPPQEVQKALSRKVRDTKKTELENARDHYKTSIDTYNFQRYKCKAVCKELDKVFLEKCAYCESRYAAIAARNVEHYRPKGKVSESDSHPGYWWLAGTWSNLLPSCPACNQLRRHIIFDPKMTPEEISKLRYLEGSQAYGKGNSFPMKSPATWVETETGNLATEDPLLINPSIRDPSKHIEWIFHRELGQPIWLAEWIFPILEPIKIDAVEDPYGRASINTYALNRLKLVVERMEKVRELQVAARTLIRSLRDWAEAPTGKVKRFRKRVDEDWEELERRTGIDQPYCGMASAFTAIVRSELDCVGL